MQQKIIRPPSHPLTLHDLRYLKDFEVVFYLKSVMLRMKFTSPFRRRRSCVFVWCAILFDLSRGMSALTRQSHCLPLPLVTFTRFDLSFRWGLHELFVALEDHVTFRLFRERISSPSLCRRSLYVPNTPHRSMPYCTYFWRRCDWGWNSLHERRISRVFRLRKRRPYLRRGK